MQYPRIRRLEAFPVQQEGREMVALRDPQGYFNDLVLLPPPLFYIASLCDGTRSVRDLQAAYVRRYGDIITSGQVTSLLEDLDRKLLLDSDRFRAYKERLDREYLSLPNRPMTCAGSAYAADPRVLVRQVENILHEAEEQDPLDDFPSAAAAPHIDLERGRECYGKLYRLLATRSREVHEPLVIILGTCHGDMEGSFALTRKNYLTPLGLVETDVGLAESLARAAGMDGLGDELSHRFEHSIEIQLPLLAFIFGGTDRFRILPVTCNTFQPFVQKKESPYASGEVSSFINALRGLISAMEGRVLLLASADLAHVGRRFGSPLPLDAVTLSSVMAKDKEMLEMAAAGDAEGFFDYIAAEGDSRHVCGLPPLYTMLKSREGRRGNLAAHCRWFDPREGSAVTFAAMIYPR